MRTKILNLLESDSRSIATEVMFEIAAARADGVGLVKFIAYKDFSEAGAALFRKKRTVLIRTLKSMKEKKLIQFYALAADFASMSTEASFLLNKYPTEFYVLPEEDEHSAFFFVKL